MADETLVLALCNASCYEEANTAMANLSQIRPVLNNDQVARIMDALVNNGEYFGAFGRVGFTPFFLCNYASQVSLSTSILLKILERHDYVKPQMRLLEWPMNKFSHQCQLILKQHLLLNDGQLEPSGEISEKDVKISRTLSTESAGVAVYKAKVNGQTVAVKRFRHNIVSGSLAAILQEIGITKNLDAHYCTRYLASYVTEDKTFFDIVMRYYEKGDLCEYVNYKVKQVTNPLAIIKRCFECVDYIHELRTLDFPKGLLHRDIKPDNFLIGLESGIEQVYLADFGLTTLREASTQYHATHKSTAYVQSRACGTVRYLAPEIAEAWEDGEEPLYSKRSDIYSLGVMVAWLITGEDPYSNFSTSSQSKIRCRIKSGKHKSHDCSNIPPVFQVLYNWCTELKEENRPQSCRVVLNFIDLIDNNLHLNMEDAQNLKDPAIKNNMSDEND